MNRMDMPDNKFWIEIIDRKKHQISVTYHDKVDKDLDLIKHLKFIMHKSYKINLSLDLPIFYKKGSEYFLVSRYWILSYYFDSKVNSFPAIVFDDASLIPQILEHEKFYKTIFNKRKTPVKNDGTGLKEATKSAESVSDDASPMTKFRTALKDAGLLCPKPECKGVLVKSSSKIRQRYIHKFKAKDLQHLITCLKKSDKHPCTFHAVLTKSEMDAFKKGELKTNEWINLLPGENCPWCNTGLVYRRTIRDGTNHPKIIDRCSKYYLESRPSCLWLRKVK